MAAGSAGGLLNKGVYDVVTVLSSAARTQSSTGTTAVQLPRPDNGIVFVLGVTAGATDGSDTLDLTVQTTLDGTNWFDAVAFTQVAGNAPTKKHVGKISTNAAQTMYEIGTSLTAGNIRHIFGDSWRVKYTITNGNAASFTFSVTALVM